jgi:hypothetical protein
LRARHAHIQQPATPSSTYKNNPFLLAAMPHTFKLKKNWVKVDKAALTALINDRDININNLSTKNVDAVGTEYFPHREH